MDIVLARASNGGQAVDFIKKNDGGSEALGLVEKKAQLPLCLTEPLGEHIAALAHEESNLSISFVAGACKSTRHRGLACARGPVKNNSSGHLHTEILEKVWVQKRQKDHFFERMDIAAKLVNCNSETHERTHTKLQTHPSSPATVEKSILGSTDTGQMSAFNALSRPAPPRWGPRPGWEERRRRVASWSLPLLVEEEDSRS